jgi:polymorphic membrane protein
MHINVFKAAAGVAAALAALAVSPAAAQAAPAAPAAVNVPCNSAALAASISGASSGGALSLAPLCVYRLTAALPDVSQALTIHGNAATLERSTASGTPSFTILTVTTGGSLTVSGLNFRNGGSGRGGAESDTPAGGALNNQGDSLSVTGGAFYGNTAEVGGAIENNFGSNLAVHGAVFNHNSAAFGGAIENDSTGLLTGDTFVGNTAMEWGGAVLTSSEGTLTNCIFLRNTAFLGGGVFATFDATVNSSAFEFNQAQFNGGAIFDDGNLALSAGRFGGNAASQSGGGLYDDIFGQSTVSGSTFSHNRAPVGGAVDNEDVLTLYHTRMSQNSADQFGGGVFTDWVMSATNSTITRNSASSGGGGIYNSDFFGPPGSVTLTSTMVASNQPDNCVNCPTTGGPNRLYAPAQAAAGRSKPLALPGAAAPAGIEKLAKTVTRGHDVLVVGARPSR